MLVYNMVLLDKYGIKSSAYICIHIHKLGYGDGAEGWNKDMECNKNDMLDCRVIKKLALNKEKWISRTQKANDDGFHISLFTFFLKLD